MRPASFLYNYISSAVLTQVCEWFFANQWQQIKPALSDPIHHGSSPTDKMTVLSILRSLRDMVIFVTLLWWIDVCLHLFDGDFSDGFEWMSVFSCQYLLLCCNYFILHWLENLNQCPGWQCWFFSRMSLCDV